MPTGAKLIKKNAYFAKLLNYIETHPMCLIVCVDNVGSKQMQRVRGALRGKAWLLMGKNTMIRTALRQRIDAMEEDTLGLGNLLEAVNGNIGFVFTNAENLQEVRDCIDTEKIPSIAKTGVLAPVDVKIPAGPTGLDPSQTSVFNAMAIPTKIVKGNIEITSEVHAVKKGEKVGSSAAALLGKLGIKPFSYGIALIKVFQDGAVFDAAVLDITDDVLVQKFMAGVANVAALGREVGIPTEAGLPHMMCNAFKNMVALISDIDFVFEQAAEIKALLSDPEALAKMQAAAAAGAASAGGAATETVAAAAPVEEEEEEDMDFDLFG